MKKLDPKSPEFRELVDRTVNMKLNLPALTIPIEKTEGVVNTKSNTLPPLKTVVLPPLGTVAKKTEEKTLPSLKQDVKQNKMLPLPKIQASFTKEIKAEKPVSPKFQRKRSPKEMRKLKSPPKPVDFVDAFAATVELTDLLQTVRSAFDKEVRMFGERGMLHEPLRQLANEINREKNMYEKRADNMFSDKEQITDIPVEVYLEMLNHWKREIKYLVDKQNGLGRRCNNAEDPISLTPIADLDNSHYIRLESAACWEVESLLDYIQNYTKGINDASKLKNYSSKTIWKDSTELNRILHHPLAVKSGFSAWFNNRKHSESANKVSEQTLRMMAWAASLLSSRGEDFRAALEKELDVKQKEEMRKAGGNIYNIQDGKIVREIQFTVGTTLKSMAVAEFFKYFNSLSKEEREAIIAFDSSFEKNVVLCNKGEFCVFGMADQLLSTRNTIAQIKKLPIVDLGNRFD
jgi:hypothetical protein